MPNLPSLTSGRWTSSRRRPPERLCWPCSRLGRSPSAGGTVAAVWADKDGGDFAFTRAGFAELLDGRRVLLVEDLVTTGGSVAKVLRQAVEHGAVIVGVSAICNRGGITAAQLAIPRLTVLADVQMQATEADRCELCAAAVPIVEDVGHGRMLKARQPDYPGGFVKLAKP